MFDFGYYNMDWDDVKEKAFLIRKGEPKEDLQEAWVNGGYEYVRQEDWHE